MSEPGFPPTPYTPPPPPPIGPSGPAVSPNRQLMIVLSYLGPLAFIPFVSEKNDPEVQWHSKNGIVLFITEIVTLVGIWFIQLILNQVVNGLGCVLGLLSPIIALGFLILSVICIMKGTSGQRFVIPVISQYADRF